MVKSLNDITNEVQQQITELAALFFTPKEIGLMLEIDQVLIVTHYNMEGNIIYKCFQSGRLQSEMELRKSIIKLAKSGSSPAQTMALKLFDESKIKLLDR